MYCRRCQKEVVIIGISLGAAAGDEIEAMRRSIEEEGKLVLFNPPPFGPRFCPDCGSQLAPADTGESRE